ncbi:hypothetical protein ACO2RV_21815, partial [Ancylobacter sp. VNQ12]|uniref:hypothetical protein n=1 Tax=Ancylobacter sp. VNQ12 TaxID=3400920 RepID=UPI003C04CDA8
SPCHDQITLRPGLPPHRHLTRPRPNRDVQTESGECDFVNGLLEDRIEVAGLLARNPVAYKWKAPFRSVVLREVIFWRFLDLMTQSHELYKNCRGLGARILLRSAIETSAILYYLNIIIKDTLDERISFKDFSDKTSRLLLGSRSNSGEIAAINIMTIIAHVDKVYSGIARIYSDLSESAHPNMDGMLLGYSKLDRSAHCTELRDRWKEHTRDHLKLMDINMDCFEYEHSTVWVGLTDKLEAWIAENDARLEAEGGAESR